METLFTLYCSKACESDFWNAYLTIIWFLQLKGYLNLAMTHFAPSSSTSKHTRRLDSPQSDSPPMNIFAATPSQFSPLHDSRENWNETSKN